jgi:hypothetical protein
VDGAFASSVAAAVGTKRQRSAAAAASTSARAHCGNGSFDEQMQLIRDRGAPVDGPSRRDMEGFGRIDALAVVVFVTNRDIRDIRDDALSAFIELTEAKAQRERLPVVVTIAETPDADCPHSRVGPRLIDMTETFMRASSHAAVGTEPAPS